MHYEKVFNQINISKLESNNILTPGGKEKWTYGTLHSILTNERYMGDAIINKTFTVDCISKKKKRNNGERAKYYVENNHPAIIDRIMDDEGCTKLLREKFGNRSDREI